MKRIESHKHWWWGENHQWHHGEETLIHMAEPRVFIRYELSEAYFADFDEFYGSIAEVQWLDGKPDKDTQERVLIDAWNFLSIEERLLEQDLEDIEIDENLDLG